MPVRYLCATLFATSINVLVHTFFTLPFFSKPTLLPLAMVVGTALAVLAFRAVDRNCSRHAS
jgi:hypothetical protein